MHVARFPVRTNAHQIHVLCVLMHVLSWDRVELRPKRSGAEPVWGRTDSTLILRILKCMLSAHHMQVGASRAMIIKQSLVSMCVY